MTLEQSFKETIEQLKKDPSEFIARYLQYTPKVLERKLDSVRGQKKMAYDQEKNII